ncbi:MAG: reverse transcriptase domain-containing protein [bacterium]|jgi:group II intron reverse transcriptase/maturase|nr:reverse transcriptase domain-containing protein [bacterium]
MTLYQQILDPVRLREGWLQVYANRGAAGIDGVTCEQFNLALDAHIAHLAAQLQSGQYRPSPLLYVWKNREDGTRERLLLIPIIADRVVQSTAMQVLSPIAEELFYNGSYAYRKGRSVQQAVLAVCQLLQEGYCWVVDADIQDFFDTIDHARLRTLLTQTFEDRQLTQLIMQWMAAPVQSQHGLQPRNSGVPQGSPISPLLANLYLDALDQHVAAQGFNHIRYADDFLILCRTLEEAEQALLQTDRQLKQIRLQLHREKTGIVHLHEGFQFLGEWFDRDFFFDTRPHEGRTAGPARQRENRGPYRRFDFPFWGR